ncbi:MAG: DUF1320 domain-containing protein [Rhodocyclaceae bacterium]|nr:DUF1320 domain-containing protein [Rhodocyclaceae bacterium]
MTYADRTALEDRYGAAEIEQRESMLTVGAVDRALADADALINGYAAGRYVVPLSPVPSNVPRLACAVARYYLLGDSNTDQSRQDFEDAVSWLKDVGVGRVTLTTAAPTPTPATGGTPVTRTGSKQFGNGGLKAY